MSVPNISEVEHPVVGNHYFVPCFYRNDFGITGWWPVIGPWHEDASLGFDIHHFHFDVRFFDRRQMHINKSDERFSLVRVSTPPLEPKLEFRRRKMMRQMPEFPISSAAIPAKAPFIEKLEAQCRHLKMKCMTCPHRGFSLKGLPVKDGMVVCNGHGARWNIETGELVPR